MSDAPGTSIAGAPVRREAAGAGLHAGLHTVERSADFLSEIVGEESRTGERMPAGPILKLMCNCAHAVAWRHSGRRPMLLGLDRLDLTRTVTHMGLVRFDGRLIEVGKSSMVIEVRCFTRRPTEQEYTPAHVGYIMMVAVDEHRKPVRDIPRLSYDSPQGREAKALAAHRKAQLEERRHALAWIESSEALNACDVREPDPIPRLYCLRPSETIVRVKSQIPAVGSPDGRVKGGDLMMMLDRVATYAARQFTRSNHVVTISVNDVLFRRPLYESDHIEMVARVSYVRTHSLEVSIDLVVHTLDGESYPLNPVEFFLLNYHRTGQKRPINVGLELDGAEAEDVRRYLKARTRFNFWKSHPESHLSLSHD
ncbi:MAG: hypothetical protein HY423_08950 [Candidatus Lambdaproteobacteria bacterium]|nr:hypothetical protein [Candidatus Lambdaproteobacteria bacterium]